MQLDVLAAAREWLADGETLALATVVETWGSSPVPVGGRMVIAGEDRFIGSVSGGCVEADVIAEAPGVKATGIPRLVRFGVSDDRAWRAGLPCGGQIEILIERLTPDDDRPLVERLLAARAAREPIGFRTHLADGRHIVIETDGVAAPIAALRAPVWRESGDVIAHSIVPAPRIVVVGATHIGQHLAEIARIAGYAVILVDPRAAFASAERWAGFERIVAWPEEALARLSLDVTTAVVALSHRADIDDEALQAALAAPCAYVGALGSNRNHARRVERLRSKGVSQQAIARIRAPVGLDIGARTPAEIALSVMAEIVLALNGRRRA